MEKKIANKGYQVLNFRDASVTTKLNISAEEIPTLVPEPIMKLWQEGDSAPYYKLQMIEYPIEANRDIYEESFFETYINKLKSRPIPGSKDGHGFFSGREQTDLILAGAKLEKNGDGTGRVFFKNYIPPEGATGSNKVFIVENKSDMIQYSLVAYAKRIVEELPDGSYKSRIVESLRGERNDAVEYDGAAMKQVTNGIIDPDDFKEGEKSMTKEEILKSLNALKENGEVTLPEIAKSMGLEGRLITEKHTNALTVIDELAAKGIADPIKEIETLKNQIKENYEKVFNAMLTEKYGAPGTAEKPNLMRSYAEKELKGLNGKALDEKIENIKRDPIMMKFAAELADETSDANTFGLNEGDNNEPRKNGITVG